MKRKLSSCISILTSFLMLTAITSVPTVIAGEETKLIALTFDDGPNTTTTCEILDILEKYDAKASFFLIGSNINEESAKSVKRAYDLGCDIGNHSKTHSNMGGMSAEEIETELSYVDEKVIEITGKATTFFRAPFIDVSQTMYDNIDLPFICGIDSKDYMQNVTAKERSDFIINNAEDGVIVLLHDAAGNDQTVEAVEAAIPVLQQQGYEFVTLTELFERQGETPKGNMLYSKVARYPCGNYSVHSNLYTGEAVGDSSWSGWSDVSSLDRTLLKELGSSYAIEVECKSSYQPVIALQKWSGTAIWTTVEPYYFNGDKACFLAEDVISALDALEVDYTDLDRMTITPSTGTITITSINLLTKNEASEDTSEPETETTEPDSKIKGDVNSDGVFNVADITSMQKYLVKKGSLSAPQAGEIVEDNILNVLDLIAMKRMLL